MSNWTIRRRIIGSFTAILLLLAAMGAVAFHQMRTVARDAHTIANDSALGAILSYQLQTEVMENFAHLQRLIHVTDKQEIARIEAAVQAGHLRQDDLVKRYDATVVTQDDRIIFDKYQAAVPLYRAAQRQVFAMSSNAGTAQAADNFDNKFVPEYTKLRTALTTVIKRNDDYTAASLVKIVNSVNTATVAMLLGTALIFLFAMAAGYILLRAVTEPLQRLVGGIDLMRQGDFTARVTVQRNDEFGLVADGFNRMTDELAALVGQVQKSGLQVNSSVTQIAATSREQQATATEIATTTAEIGATSTEISATSRQLVSTMTQVAAVAEQSAALAGDSQAGLEQMSETMRQVMAATKGINTKLVVLNEKASNINQVIITISKVAEQTNLLSLNAAIEAEKAGEHGRGFSVVATEIRRLADQTAVATYDIGQTVKEIQGAVSSSVMAMDKFSDQVRRGMDEVQVVGRQLSKIIEQVQTLAPRVEDVNEGMRGQSLGAEQITQALLQLNQAAQQTVESLRQSTMAIDDLNQVSLSLRGGVSRFKLRA